MQKKLLKGNKESGSFVVGNIRLLGVIWALLPVAGMMIIISYDRHWLVIVATFAIIAAYNIFLLYYLYANITANVSNITAFYEGLSKGSLTEPPPAHIKLLQPVVKAQKVLISELHNIKSFFIEIGKGNLENNIKVFNDSGELGQTILDVRAELKKVAMEDRQRNWTNEGLSKLGEILRKENDLNRLSDKILSELVKYVAANQGYLFIINDNEDDHFLELKSAFAFDKKKYLEKKIFSGEGLAGQAWLEGDTIFMSKIPADYVNITSGLGGATPTSLLIVPLKNDNEIHGVLELASFTSFEAYQIQFVEKIAESIAVTYATGKSTERTQSLLDETRLMTEQVKAQEEEMRQNMEEMNATQEEMLRKQQEMDEHQRMMNSIMKSTPGAVYRSYTDAQWTKIYVSPKVEQIVGYTPDEFMSKKINLVDITHPEDVNYVQREVMEAIKQRRQYELNYKLIHKNGGVVYIWEIGEAIYSSEGKEIFIEGIMMDVTKDHLLRKDLAYKQSLLNGLINNTEDNIMALDRDYNVTIINDRYKERYATMGYNYGEGTNAFSVMDKSIHAEWKGYYDRALSGERFSFQKTVEDEVHIITREYSFNPIRDKDGMVTGLSIFNRTLSDITK